MTTRESIPPELGIPALRAGLANIEKYLFTNGTERELSARALVAMRSVVERMTAGAYPFVPNKSLDLAKLGKLLDSTSSTIVTIRPATTFSLTVPDGMAYGGWFDDVWMPLLRQMEPDGGQRPAQSYGVELHAHLYRTEFTWFIDGECRRHPVSEVRRRTKEWTDLFRSSLPFSAWRESAFPDDIDSGYSLRQVLEANLSYPLSLLGLFALAGHTAGFEKMETLATVLQQCIPVGVNADNVWVIAAA